VVHQQRLRHPVVAFPWTIFPGAVVMPKIKAESLQPGMVVAKDVKNLDNMLLIPSGCELTERQIDILLAWGVDEIEVEAAEGAKDESDPLAALSPEALAQLAAEVKALFWKPDESNPVYQEVFQLMLRRRARKHPAH
jgi:hypothetical protein